MTFHWPQMAEIGIMLVSSGVVLAKHGQPTRGTYNIYGTLIAHAVNVTILYYGGFFG